MAEQQKKSETKKNDKTQNENKGRDKIVKERRSRIDLTKKLRLGKVGSDKIPTYAPRKLFKLSRRSHPVIEVERTFYTHEGQKAAKDLLEQGIMALAEIFIFSRSVKTFVVMYDPQTKARLPEGVIYNGQETRTKISSKLFDLLNQFEYRHKTYTAWVMDRIKDGVKLKFSNPANVRFTAFNRESMIFADIVIYYDACVRILYFAEVVGEISTEEKERENSIMKKELAEFVKDITNISLAMYSMRKMKKSK